MTERYSFIDGGVVWNQDNIENSTLTETIHDGYVTAEEDSPTRYLSVLDTTGDISLENLNITLTNPKLEVEDAVDACVEELPEENNDQVVVFSVEGSEDLYGIQLVQDEDGNVQKYQFQFRRNEEGQLEAIPETITLIPMDEDVADTPEVGDFVAEEEQQMQIFVQEDDSNEHILPDTNEHILPDTHIDEEAEGHEVDGDEDLYESEEAEEETVDIKPGVLQLQNVKQEMQENQPALIETEEFSEFQTLTEEEPQFEYPPEPQDIPEQQEQQEEEIQEESHPEKVPEIVNGHEFEHVEVSPDMAAVQTQENDSDENDYQIVEGLHITGDLEEDPSETLKPPNSNILRHALKGNKEAPKLVKKDNKLYLYVVQHPEKENVDSLSLEMSNLCKPKVNPRSILKSSHAMFQAQNEIECEDGHDDRISKRFAKCKEVTNAMMFHNFINKTTIPQAPVRKNRLPRKQKIKPVERMDEEIVVQEVMVSNNGFVETVAAGINKENLAVTEYVELTDSDDDYDPKRVNRKKKKHRRKKISITISDSDSTSVDSIIELDESDDEPKEDTKNNNATPPKRRRGRPPKNKPGESPATNESPAKKSKVETLDNPKKPEIPCPKCDKTFPSQNSLKTHLQHHNLQSSIKKILPEYKYKCDKCGTTFINNILLKKHMCSKLFSCTVCKKKFSDLPALNGHKRTHTKEAMVKTTTTVRISPKKMKPLPTTNTFKVPKSTALKCKNCGKLCSSLQNLNVHMKSHKEFTCNTCAQTFLSQLMLEKHVRDSCVKSPRSSRKSIFRVKCDKCEMQFGSNQALFKHKVATHGLETPDKDVLKRGEGKTMYKGVPAAKRLQGRYEELKCQLEFLE